MLVAGLGVRVLGRWKGGLGREMGYPGRAATVVFVGAFSVALIAALLTQPQAATRLASAPKYLFVAGTLVAFYILSITWIAPVIGVGNAVFFVLLGQLISAAAIDHFGLFAAQVTPLTHKASSCSLEGYGEARRQSWEYRQG